MSETSNATVNLVDVRFEVQDPVNELLKEVLAYLKRDDVGGTIYARRTETGIVGAESRRLEIAEKVEKFLVARAL